MALAGFAVGRQRTLSMWSGKSCLFVTGFCDWWCKFLLSGCVPLGTMFMWALPLDPAEAVV